jgi:hypothetical protein
MWKLLAPGEPLAIPRTVMIFSDHDSVAVLHPRPDINPEGRARFAVKFTLPDVRGLCGMGILLSKSPLPQPLPPTTPHTETCDHS